MRGFFVATHFNRGTKQQGWQIDRVLPRLRELGVTGVRDECNWASVEKVKGEYAVPEGTRAWMDKVRDAGLKEILVLNYGNKIYENNLDPDAFAGYAAFMAREAKKYPNIVAIEIWNEPGNFFFRKQYGGEWNGKDRAPWVGKFAELVAKSTAAIHRENPDVKIIAGAAVPPANHHLIAEYPDAFKNVDAIAEHPYTYNLPPEVTPWGGAKINERDGISVADDTHSMKSLIAGFGTLTKEKIGRELPVYVTEFGISTFTKQDKTSLYAGYTDAAQAAYHARALVQGIALGVPVWTVYDMVEDGTAVGDEECHFGLLRYDTDEPKPAFHALSRIARLLGPDWKYLGADAGSLSVVNKAAANKSKDEWANPTPDPYSLSGPQTYWFEVPDGYVAFVWNAGRLNAELRPVVGTLNLKARHPVTSAELLDLCTGETSPLKPTSLDGSVRLANVPVGGWPVAVKLSTK